MCWDRVGNMKDNDVLKGTLVVELVLDYCTSEATGEQHCKSQLLNKNKFKEIKVTPYSG